MTGRHDGGEDLTEDEARVVRGARRQRDVDVERSRYVVLDDEDLAKARPESTRIINLNRFADMDSIDPRPSAAGFDPPRSVWPTTSVPGCGQST